MIALPRSATPMASQVRPATRSPIQTHPSSPAMNGLRLWMIRTFATEVRSSAMMKHVEAMAKHTAMPTPVRPMLAKTPGVARPSRAAVTASRKAAQKSPRQNTVVHGSVSTVRANRPPRLQKAAAAATRSRPRRRSWAPSGSAGPLIGRARPRRGGGRRRSPGQGRGFPRRHQAITMENASMAYSLRLIEDRLAAGGAAPASHVPRVLYAAEGALLADGTTEPVAAVGPRAAGARAAATAA